MLQRVIGLVVVAAKLVHFVQEGNTTLSGGLNTSTGGNASMRRVRSAWDRRLFRTTGA